MPDTLPLSPLDLVSAKLHRRDRPLDFAVIVSFHDGGPDEAALRCGAESARRAFPPSGSVVDGRDWCWSEAPADLSVETAADAAEAQAAIEAFVDSSFDPHTVPPVRQVLVHDATGGPSRLATRFHHCAFDGVSAVLWLVVQLGVAAETLSPVEALQDWSPPQLRDHSAPVRRSRYAFTGPAGRVWSAARRPSHRRRWMSFELAAEPLRAAVAVVPEVTYNDLLACSLLETLIRWNAQHGARADNLGIWLPVNIRATPFGGFGNGSSRIRVYGRWSPEATASERCVCFREQVKWSKDNGEWHVPTDSALLRQPDWLLVPLLRAWLGRPWVDMGSAVFSHVEQIGPAAEVLDMIRSTEWVTMLHERFPVGMVGATLEQRTSLSLTWDPEMMDEDDAAALLELYRSTLDETAAGLKS